MGVVHLPSTELQRLFYRAAKSLTHPFEDFLSEVIRIAVLHDAAPLTRLLESLPEDRWRDSSGRADVGLFPLGGRVIDVETQAYLEAKDGRLPGRLDVRIEVALEPQGKQEVWIEVKVDAPLTPRQDGATQLDVYPVHRLVEPAPQPVLITLARESTLDPRVTGVSWKELAEAVDESKDVDRWWTDLVAFLRADGIAPHRLPSVPLDVGEFMSVFKAANRCLKESSDTAPMSLRWPAIENAVLGGAKSFTAGPMTWGMDLRDDRWVWYITMANYGYPGITVPIEEVLAAGREAALESRGWTRIEGQQRKRTLLFEKSRPLVAGDSDLEVGAWFVIAFRELSETGMLEPHFRRVRAKQDLRRSTPAP